MGSEIERHYESDVLPCKAKAEVKRPAKYQVVLKNDDYTPMDFVIVVLQAFFYMDFDKAVAVMMKVHQDGRAVCGIFTREIAETKVAQVNRFSRFNEHPLLCTMEKM